MDGAFSKNFILKLSPKLNGIPYVSGEEKCFRNYYINILKHEMHRVLPSKLDQSRRNENIAWSHPSIARHLNGSSSEITQKLEKFIKRNLDKPQFYGIIKSECALRMYLFLRQAEKNLGVEFICQ